MISSAEPMSMTPELYHWVIFNLMIIGLLILDLWYFHRDPHAITIKEALLTSVAWISLALLFNLWIYYSFGQEMALNFFTGYLLEKSLSLDNLFIFLLIFSHFKVPKDLKHHVLFYGILGAIVMRATLILGGVVLVNLFHWIFYLFGAFLFFTGLKLFFSKEEEIQYEKTLAYRLLSSYIPLTSTYHGKAFLIKQEGRWTGTPLLVILTLVETTDFLFALDSVPAILAITTDPFIVYTSNIFAILGLRSLFFALEGVMQRFYLFHYALSIILIFIGIKMILVNLVHIPTWITLIFMLVLLIAALIGSLIFPQNSKSPK